MKSKPPSPAAVPKKDKTIVFGEELEKNNFLKTPKALILIRAFDDPVARRLKPRHLHMILVLGAKKYKDKMIRYYWARLAQDLGVSIDAARKCAYQLKKMGLIRIIAFTGKRKLTVTKKLPSNPGYRNDANGFDLSPLFDLITRNKVAIKAAKDARRLKYAEAQSK